MCDVCEGDFGADAFDDEDFGGGISLTKDCEDFAKDWHADGDGWADRVAEVWLYEDAFGGVGGGGGWINKFCCCGSVYGSRVGCSGVRRVGGIQDSYAWIRGRV